MPSHFSCQWIEDHPYEWKGEVPKVIFIILPKIISKDSFNLQDGMPVAAVTKSFDGCYQW